MRWGHETQRDYWRLMRPKGTHETQRHQWGLMRLRETRLMRLRETWRLMTNGD